MTITLTPEFGHALIWFAVGYVGMCATIGLGAAYLLWRYW